MCRILGSLLLGVIQFPVTSAKRISVYKRQHYWHSAQHAILSERKCCCLSTRPVIVRQNIKNVKFESDHPRIRPKLVSAFACGHHFLVMPFMLFPFTHFALPQCSDATPARSGGHEWWMTRAKLSQLSLYNLVASLVGLDTVGFEEVPAT